MRDAVRTVDELVGRFVEVLRSDDRWPETVVNVVSEYGFQRVDTPIYPNRALRDAGLLTVEDDGRGREEVDRAVSQAFAMVDHQVAHVYANDGVVDDAREALRTLDEIEHVLDVDEKSEHGIDHPNAGDLVCVAESSAWFQYYWWRDDENVPEYATDMDIHAKPGFDPCELFVGESGLVSLDPTRVGGSHGRTDVAGFYGLRGPAAPSSTPREVTAQAVAPTLADLLAVRDELAMSFERESILA